MADEPISADFEVWLPVVGYEGSYEVSSFGRVRSLSRYREQWSGPLAGNVVRFLRGRELRQVEVLGYLKVGLSDQGKQRQRFVHRLVCEAFLGPLPLGMQVAHGDGDSLNNRLNNLRYATPADNLADQLTHGTRCNGVRHHSSKLSESDVRAIRQCADRRQDCVIARRLGVSSTAIRQVRHGKTWKHIE